MLIILLQNQQINEELNLENIFIKAKKHNLYCKDFI